jgi:thiamine biosynthesis lipoprotein
MTTRRRFLALTAAALATPAAAASAGPVRWRGMALGAPASVEIHGEPERARAALREVVVELRRLERVFSLHDPASSLSRLNREGWLPEEAEGSDELAVMLDGCLWYRSRTRGLFNPLVQPVWRALAEGRRLPDAERLLSPEGCGWRDGGLGLAEGKQATFNGVAQGYVADRLMTLLDGRGFGRILLDTGEIRATGGPWRIALEDPGLGRHGWLTLEDGGALATSSPDAMLLADGGSHIVTLDGPRRPPWSSVTVQAEDATHADAASTALALTRDREEAELTVARLSGVIEKAVLVDREGNVSTLLHADELAD